MMTKKIYIVNVERDKIFSSVNSSLQESIYCECRGKIFMLLDFENINTMGRITPENYTTHHN
jgi:hypothetical protein